MVRRQHFGQAARQEHSSTTTTTTTIITVSIQSASTGGSGGDWGGGAVRRAAQLGVLGTAKEVGTVLTALANDVLLFAASPHDTHRLSARASRGARRSLVLR